jgi:hypothetical protein
MKLAIFNIVISQQYYLSHRSSGELAEQYVELADDYYVMEKGSIVMHGSSATLDKEAIKPYQAF